ncbi:MAG TPA: cupredoxin domain-containing protein [Gemmatimonadaceae bacterium]|nr:cupredoxin domain-containing protein [Gemmatimonadaceae bacterium]
MTESAELNEPVWRSARTSAARSFRRLALALVTIACAKDAPVNHYRPRTRELTVTAVPLLTKELQSTYSFLAQDFGRGGVLEGKEVYTFVPSSLTVVQGDTIHFTLINPEDDAHSFVLPGLAVTLRPQSKVLADYIARNAGVFEYVCDIPAHLPFMYGQLVVLAAN